MALTSNQQTVAVIGAGVIGINCALALQLRGYQVSLFDPRGIAEACSKGNAGHFATEQVFPLAQASMLMQVPKMLLDSNSPLAISARHLPDNIPWFIQFIANMRPSAVAQSSAALTSLNRRAIDYYQPLISQAGCAELLTRQGSLLVFEQTSLSAIRKIQRKFAEKQVNVELLNQQQMQVLEPGLHSKINYGLYFPDVGHTIAPQKLCLKLAELANNLGMHFKQAAVAQVIPQSDSVLVATEDQRLRFDKVVVATGAWSASLVSDLGYKLPMQAERGYHLQLMAHPSLSRPVTSAERKFIMTPMNDGLRLAGTVEYATIDSPMNINRTQALYRNAQHILAELPQVNPEFSPWLGSRPSLPDSLPVISKASNHDHIFFAFGHHHLGLTQGAITGTLIAQLIAGQATDIDMKPFDIARFN